MPFRWGILSTAQIGRTMFIPGVRAGAEGEVVAIASRDAQRANAAAADLGIPRAYRSYGELLADPEVEGVYIGLPNSLHAEWTIAAAQAGKHVLCEKPIARRAEQAERMAEACRAAGVVFMEAFMWRHHPQHARVQALIQQGAIGAPTLVRACFSYVIQPNTAQGLNIRLAPDLEGGSLMDIGCYPVNVARWAFQAEPVECIATQVIDPSFGVDATFAGVLRFDGDRLSIIDSSLRHANTQRYEIVGTEGRIIVERAFRPDTLPGVIRIVSRTSDSTEEVPAANQYGLQADHFARSVRAGRLLPPAEDGVAQAAVVEALYASAGAGRSVSVGAAAMRDRP